MPVSQSGESRSVRRRSVSRAVGLSAALAVAMPAAHSLAVVTEGAGDEGPDETYAAADAGSLGLPPPPLPGPTMAPAADPRPVPELAAPATSSAPPPQVAQPEPPPAPPAVEGAGEAAFELAARISAADAAEVGGLSLVDGQPELAPPEPPSPPDPPPTPSAPAPAEPVTPEGAPEPPPATPVVEAEEPAPAEPPAANLEPPATPEPAPPESRPAEALAEPPRAPEDETEEPEETDEAAVELAARISAADAAEVGGLSLVDGKPKLAPPEAPTTPPAMEESNRGQGTPANPPVATAELSTPSIYAAGVSAAPLPARGSEPDPDAASDAYTLGVGDVGAAGAVPTPRGAAGPDAGGASAAAAPLADPAMVAEHPDARSVPQGGSQRAISEGESLWQIAADELGGADNAAIAAYVEAIVAANGDQISNPDLIAEGAELTLPAPESSGTTAADESPYVPVPEFGPPATGAVEPVPELGPSDLPSAIRIAEDRLAAEEDPAALHLINPATGREYTDQEIVDALGRAGERADAGRGGPDGTRTYSDARQSAVIAAEDRLFASSEPDREHIINPATGREYSDGEIAGALGRAGERRIEDRADDFTLEQKVSVARSLGFEVPEDLTPADVAGLDAVVGLIPDALVGPLVNEGMTARFDAPIPGLRTPGRGIIGGSVGTAITRTIEVELGDVEIGPGFEETQVFEVAVSAGYDLDAVVGGKTGRQRLWGYYGRMRDGRLPRWTGRVLPGWTQRPLPPWARVPDPPGRLKPVQGYRGQLEANHEFASELRYEAVVDDERGDRLAAGDMTALPDILAPLEMDQGNSLLIRGSRVSTTTFAGRYRIAYGETDFSRLDGLGFGVERLEGDRVRIVAGPVDAVEESILLGVKKFGVVLGAEAGHSYETRDLRFAELDLGTPEGRVAYQDFILSGRVASVEGADGNLSGETRSDTVETDVGLRFSVGAAELGLTLIDDETTFEVAELDDGTRRGRYASNTRGKTTEVDLVFDGDAVDLEGSTYTFVVAGNSGGSTERMWEAFGSDDRAFAGDHDIELQFTGSELMQLAAMARERVRESEDWEEGRFESVLANPDAFDVTQQLAAAENPEAAFVALHGNFGGRLVEDLMALGVPRAPGGVEETLPGEISVQPSS